MDIKALVVDDEQLAREELCYLLGQAGGVTVVAQAANGVDALEAIEAHAPDLVFLDVQMPGLNGFEVARRVLDRQDPGLEPGDAAFVARAPRLDALADPRLLLRPELVEAAPRHGLGGKLVRLQPLERRKIPGVGPQQAAGELGLRSVACALYHAARERDRLHGVAVLVVDR